MSVRWSDVVSAALGVAVVTTLAGCATPQTRTALIDTEATRAEAHKQRLLVVKTRAANEWRLHDIGHRIVTGAVAHCVSRGLDPAPKLGITVWSTGSFAEDWRAAAAEAFDLSDAPRIGHVVPGSAADRAGVRAGDQVVAVAGEPVPTGPNAATEALVRIGEVAGREAAVPLRLARDGTERVVSVVPDPACDYPMEIKDDDTKNAFADGKRIVVHSGMMDFFRTDEEAALVLCHELAHNTMGHLDAQQQNAMIGTVGGLLVDIALIALGANTQGKFARLGGNIGAGAFSVDFEREADYVGLYIMAMAGYRIDGAADFWRRMAVANPDSIVFKSTHPTAPERFLTIENAVAEISAKIAAGRPLQPEMKDDAPSEDDEAPDDDTADDFGGGT